MSFVSLLTGRNNLYSDEDKIKGVIEQLEMISNSELEKAKDTIANEVKKLNNCTGFTQYVSSDIHPHVFDPIIESGQESIRTLIETINMKVDDIKAYSESSLGDKVFSTYLMTNFKVAEGFLSVFEGIGDGVVSIVGWAAPKNSGVENWCSKFIEKNYSHDAFNFYYNSSLAKASMITEDSGIAKMCKFAGEAAGYYVTGSALMKAFGTTSNLTKAGSIFQKMQKAGVIEGTLYGMGNTTQGSLQQGASMDDAAKRGSIQGAIDGALAMAIPVALEKTSKSGFTSKAKDLFNTVRRKIFNKRGSIIISMPPKPITRKEIFDDLFKIVGEETKVNYKKAITFNKTSINSNGARDIFSMRSKVEILAQKAIESGDYSNPGIREKVNRIIKNNVAEYLGGNSAKFNKVFKKIITEDNSIEKVINGIDDMSRVGSVQNLVEDRATSIFIRDVYKGNEQEGKNIIVKNIRESLDNKFGNREYNLKRYDHIITFDEISGQNGGYHKDGSLELSGKYTTTHIAHPTEPIHTTMINVKNPHEKLIDNLSGGAVEKNLFPQSATHQQIVDQMDYVVKRKIELNVIDDYYNATRSSYDLHHSLQSGEMTNPLEFSVILEKDKQTMRTMYATGKLDSRETEKYLRTFGGER